MSDTTNPPVAFTTGLAPLPDIGSLEYNGCTFSSLFASRVNAVVEQDDAKRTVKLIALTIEVEGVVTLNKNQTTTDNVMLTLRQQLEVDGGMLTYSGRGFGTLTINAPGSSNSGSAKRDLNWGPKPNLMEFQPLGAGRGAMVKWSVTTWIYELKAGNGNVLQFNEEISIGYDEECYSTISYRGVLEIGLTRQVPSGTAARTLTTTVDDQRQRWIGSVGVDLTRFRVVRRDFNVSRDRRVMDWTINLEELPPAVMPPGAPVARGTFRFQPTRKGLGLIGWTCSLRCTYTIRKDWPRRYAWTHFAQLLWYRMKQAEYFAVPGLDSNAAAAQNPVAAPQQPVTLQTIVANFARGVISSASGVLKEQGQAMRRGSGAQAFLIHLAGEEGLYLDARTVTFEAQYTIRTKFANILLATGLWRYVNMRVSTTDPDYQRLNNAWAISMKDISGPTSWLENQVNTDFDAIVDFGADGP